MKKLEHDTRDIILTPEFIIKGDKDIATIAALNRFSEETGNILVLSGGYATEAHCGGVIARPHGDIDAHLILTGFKSPEELFQGVRELLYSEDTKWILREQGSDKIDYLENDEHKEFFNKRRVEIRLNAPHEANIKYPKKRLINSKGKEIEVCVLDLGEMVSGKIHKFYELRNGVDTAKDRHSSESDYFDLKRLLALKELSTETIIDILASMPEFMESPGARKKATEEYNFIISLLKKHI